MIFSASSRIVKFRIVAEIDRSGAVLVGQHQPGSALDEVVDIGSPLSA
jgi:hypothetical protein